MPWLFKEFLYWTATLAENESLASDRSLNLFYAKVAVQYITMHYKNSF